MPDAVRNKKSGRNKAVDMETAAREAMTSLRLAEVAGPTEAEERHHEFREQMTALVNASAGTVSALALKAAVVARWMALERDEPINLLDRAMISTLRELAQMATEQQI